MELRYLETVIAVAEYQSFSRAAEELPCSQASVSRQVSAVERELGYTIFERSTRSGSVSLTPEGRTALEQIRGIVARYRQLFVRADPPGGTTYRLGLFAGPFSIIARSRIVSQTYINSPELHLVIEDVRRSEFLSVLTQAKIDGIFMYESYLAEERPRTEVSYRQGSLDFEFLKTQELHVAVPKTHRFAGRESIAFAELRDETVLLDCDITRQQRPAEDSPHGSFLKNCTQAGFTPKVVTLNSSVMEFANIRDAVIQERGWVYPTFKLPALHDNTDVVLVPVRDALYYAQYFFVTLTSRPTLSREKLSRSLSELCAR